MKISTKNLDTPILAIFVMKSLISSSYPEYTLPHIMMSTNGSSIRLPSNNSSYRYKHYCVQLSGRYGTYKYVYIINIRANGVLRTNRLENPDRG